MDKKKDYVSIGQISEIYGIPATTLYYWEKEKLINPAHNPENNYREYSLVHTFVEIGDTNFYRSIDIPIGEIKKIKSYDAAKIRDTLKNSGKQIEQKIEAYTQKLKVINERIALLDEILSAPQGEFKRAEIPFDKAIFLERGNKTHIKRYLDDPNCFVTIGKIGQELCKDINCIAVEADFPGKTVFENERDAEYLSSYFKSATHNTQNNNFNELVDKLKELGVECKNYITQFLISFCDEGGVQYDCYRVWFKVEKQ